MKSVLLRCPRSAYRLDARGARGGCRPLVSERVHVQRLRTIGAALVAIARPPRSPPRCRSSQPAAIEAGRLGSSIERDKHLIHATRFPRKGDDDVV